MQEISQYPQDVPKTDTDDKKIEKRKSMYRVNQITSLISYIMHATSTHRTDITDNSIGLRFNLSLIKQMLAGTLLKPLSWVYIVS